MSKIGKKIINLPEEVKITEVSQGRFEIKGPKGVLFFELPSVFKLEEENKIVKVVPLKDNLDKKTKALWGTLRSLLNNKVLGVKDGFEKVLILQGLGYSAEVKEDRIFFKLGYSHPVELEIPSDVKVEIKTEKGKSLIYVRGIDKEKVGAFAFKIKRLKPADVYHMKGFRYADEVIKLKPVKKSAK